MLLSTQTVSSSEILREASDVRKKTFSNMARRRISCGASSQATGAS
jgi:hypothetical protein